MVSQPAWRYLVETLAETRIQLCGRLVARIDGRRVEGALPGRQGRLAFAYLAVNRHRPVTRDELLGALWTASRQRPTGSARSSRSCVRSFRWTAVVKSGWCSPLTPGSTSRRRPRDCTAPRAQLLRATSRLPGLRDAWRSTSPQEFLPGEDEPWVDDQRRRLEEILVRSLELVGRACVEIGAGELDTAERAARNLIAHAPYRESGHRLLMETLAARGNTAEALLVYDALRQRLRDELGAAPSAETKQLHRRLLG